MLPTVRGDRVECLAMTEPGAVGSARHENHGGCAGDFIINAPSTSSVTPTTRLCVGEETTARGTQEDDCLSDHYGTSGLEVRPDTRTQPHRGYTNSILEFNNCRSERRDLESLYWRLRKIPGWERPDCGGCHLPAERAGALESRPRGRGSQFG
jgi:hypothetical protein